MDISLSIDLNPKPKVVKTSSLFFDQYRWSVHAYLRAASCLRHYKNDRPLDQAVISRRLQNRNGRFVGKNNLPNWGGSWVPNENASQEKATLKNLLEFRDLVANFDSHVKLMFYTDWVYIYCDKVEQVKSLVDFSGLTVNQILEADACLPKDCVLLENPRHRYRSFFCDRGLDNYQIKALRSWLISRPDISCSRALKDWCNMDMNASRGMTPGLRRYWFFDHDDVSVLRLMDFVLPGVIRDTFPIQAK